ncbi:MAG TPA: hydrogenase maturation nickel metallochaperone HypA [Armatimonadota bacterium]|nr:hydrogenase maturation nickel metallochaperone HypA [Armatimonadota bacterium]
MHELTATQNILSIALSEAAKVGAARITRISVKVGEWSTFEPDCIRFYFDIIARGTPAEDAALAIETIPVTYACEECGLEYTPVEGRFRCPRCSGVGGTVVSGREIYVESIEVQHADTGDPKSPGGE